MKSHFPETIKGYKLEALSKKPLAEFAHTCYKVAQEGVVLLKNDNDTLPIKKGSCVSVFGRIQEQYYGMGTGSGGGVHPIYKTDILSSFRKRDDATINEKLAKLYSDWSAEHPFEDGGWIKPFSQKEMPLDEKTVKEARKCSDFALIIIGRTAGEDRDSKAEAGSYYLSELEEDMIQKVCREFEKVCVFLNIGSVMDMSWVEKYNPSSVVCGWQCGQEGGAAAVSVLMGDSSPCGKLSDTIAYRVEDYPSTANFGYENKNRYVEDIYVGYRYFETFAPDAVQYPFGFGLSYTTFEIAHKKTEHKDNAIEFTFSVKNTGAVAGKEVVQVYISAPQGTLGKPAKVLVGYAKTKTISPDKTGHVKVSVPLSYLASYDDSGKTGHKSCFVMECGKYVFLAGNSSKNVTEIYSFEVSETVVTEKLKEACAPTEDLMRMIPKATENGFAVDYEPVPKRTYDIYDRINAQLPEEIAYTGDKGLKLVDAAEGKCSMDDFIAQLSDFDLMCLCRGEGMQSPKVDMDTASIFGGVTDELLAFGIPIVTTNDGPCGIRDLVKGAFTTSMPNGTCIACTFNDALVEKLLTYEGLEMHAHSLDTLLGPGINIHRNPLCGRNFEYFSEDPLLAGKIAAAMNRGAHLSGKSLTIKHMMANSQETNRTGVDAVVSERAIREIYLRAFELAIKDGNCDSIMTSYNPVNGIWCASNYDLNTVIVRSEWGFDGIIMTDWWARGNLKEGVAAYKHNLAEIIKSQNDLYMIVDNSKTSKDNLQASLDSGALHRSELQRCAKNICSYIIRTKAFDNFVKNGYNDPAEIIKRIDSLKTYKVIENGKSGSFNAPLILDGGIYVFRFTYSAAYPDLEQKVAFFNFNETNGQGCTFRNTDGKLQTIERVYMIPKNCKYFSISLPDSITIHKIEALAD